MDISFRFKENPDDKRAPVTFIPGESRGDKTIFGYFMCPVCRKANYIAQGDPENSHKQEGSCVWCGCKVCYRKERTA